MSEESSRIEWETGRDEFAKRGGYTNEAEMTIPEAPLGPGAGATDVGTQPAPAPDDSAED